jgi:hypothetical protein
MFVQVFVFFGTQNKTSSAIQDYTSQRPAKGAQQSYKKKHVSLVMNEWPIEQEVL